jgi:hypothetical protein
VALATPPKNTGRSRLLSTVTSTPLPSGRQKTSTVSTVDEPLRSLAELVAFAAAVAADTAAVRWLAVHVRQPWPPPRMGLPLPSRVVATARAASKAAASAATESWRFTA